MSVKFFPQHFLITLVLLTLLSVSQRALATVSVSNLFEVAIPLTEESQVHLTKKKLFNQALAKAARVELIKLSGRLDIVKTEAALAFLKYPRGYLKSYQYLAVKNEGVVIGQKLLFQFDKKQIYSYFQQNNLVIWPMTERPVTLVYGSQKIEDSVIKISEQNIQELIRLNYQDAAVRLSLPIVIPTNLEPWVFPDKQNPFLNFQGLLESQQANYVMTFQEDLNSKGEKFFAWKLYDLAGEMVKSGSSSNISALINLRDVFATLLQLYSTDYREQADFLNSVVVTVEGINTFERFNQTEKILKKLKPLIHQVRLIKLDHGAAVFELVYQGEHQNFLKQVQGLQGLKFESEDPLTGEMNMVWRAAQ